MTIIHLNRCLDDLIQLNVTRSVWETYREHVFKDGRRINIDKLMNRVKSRPVKNVPMKDLTGIDRSKRSGFSLKRLAKADTRIPILIDPDNGILDGRHRVIKHQSEGHRKINAIRVTDKDIEAVKLTALLDDMIEFKLSDEEKERNRKERARRVRTAAGLTAVGALGSIYGLQLLHGRQIVKKVRDTLEKGAPEVASGKIIYHKFQLSPLLDGLIQFKLYQPGEEDQPPATLPRFTREQMVDYVEQEHHAKRAGKHTDIRIGNRRGMYSWATKKDLPEPGGKIQLHPQPIHPASYNTFEGEIPSGYGAGTVQTRHLGKALVTRSDPDQTNITVGTKRGSHRLAILNTKLGHLLVREKHPESPTAPKPAYKSLRGDEAPEYLRTLPPGSVVQPKIDGALVHVKSHQGKLEIFSHRKNKEGNPILHTERFFKGRPKVDLEGKTITGELYGTRKGKAIEPQELGGILNAHLSKSLDKQKQGNVKLKIMPFDLQDKGTYPERLERLKSLVTRHLPKDKFTLPEEAHTPKEALDLHERIRAGRHPLTSEGIVIHPPTGKMIKVKNTEETNVKIAGTFEGTGKFAGSPGGFYYADKKGNPVGRVGTGFSDETRRELKKYVGRTARIQHQGQYKSGAYRAASLVAIDESR